MIDRRENVVIEMEQKVGYMVATEDEDTNNDLCRAYVGYTETESRVGGDKTY